MRRLAPLLILPLLLACGDRIEHPPAAPDCDRSVSDCRGLPPAGGGVGKGGGEGGDGSSGDQTTDWTGELLAYTGDDFTTGSLFEGAANVSATGVSGARVRGTYDGATFSLQNIVKASTNWFLVEPEAGAGLLPTLTPVDTRAVKNDELAIGVVRAADIDGIFALALAATDRSDGRAQLVVRVVDSRDRSVSGVKASLTAELTAYRGAGTWDSTEGAATDDSGLIFFGNVPATSAIGATAIELRGPVTARVEARIKAGVTTVLTAVVSPP